MQPKAPQAVGTGVGLVGFLTVFLVVSLNGVYHADPNLGNEVINGV